MSFKVIDVESAKKVVTSAYDKQHVFAHILWLGGLAVRALDTRPKNSWFNAQPMRYQVTQVVHTYLPV